MLLPTSKVGTEGQRRGVAVVVGFTLLELSKIRDVLRQPLPDDENARAAQRRFLIGWRRWTERLTDRVRLRIEQLR